MTGGAAYLDASAFVKLVIVEDESKTLKKYLADWPLRVSSSLLRTEALRAVRAHGSRASERARTMLHGVRLSTVTDGILDSAGHLGPDILRTLDAIHLATALDIGDDLGVLVTYDTRMSQGAHALGLTVAAPA